MVSALLVDTIFPSDIEKSPLDTVLMDISQFAQLGAQIAACTSRLKDLRSQRDEINRAIKALEDEVRPLVVEHAKMVADLVSDSGGVTPSTPVVVAQGVSSGPVNGRAPSDPSALRKRVIDYLARAEEGTSAYDVAEALREDPFEIRQIMHDFLRNR